MSYQWGTACSSDTTGLGIEWADPTVVLVVQGTHDVSRIVQALAHGNVEQADLARRISASLKRRPSGRSALELLRRHGGPDMLNTGPEPLTVDADGTIAGHIAIDSDDDRSGECTRGGDHDVQWDGPAGMCRLCGAEFCDDWSDS